MPSNEMKRKHMDAITSLYGGENPRDKRIEATKEWADGKNARLSEIRETGAVSPWTTITSIPGDMKREIQLDAAQFRDSTFNDPNSILGLLPFVDDEDDLRDQAFEDEKTKARNEWLKTQPSTWDSLSKQGKL